jgi:hypothetical protein
MDQPDYDLWLYTYEIELQQLFSMFQHRFKKHIPKKKLNAPSTFDLFCEYVYEQSSGRIGRYDYRERRI